MVIDRNILSFLLDITRDDAQKKIAVALAKVNGGDPYNIYITESKDISIEADQYEEVTGIPVTAALESIKKGCLKQQRYVDWLMIYPSTKLKKNKMGMLPKTVQLPPTLRRLICPEDRDKIKELWVKKYQFKYSTVEFK